MQEYRTLYISFVAFFATIAGLLFGFDTAIISGALKFILIDLNIDKSNFILQEFIVSSVPLGAFIGSIISKYSSNLLGRKKSISVTSILFSLGTIISICQNNVDTVIIGRLIMGLGVGLSSMIVPMYLSEISPFSIRGTIVFCYQLAVTIGLLLAFLTNYVFSISGNWRHMFLIGLFPSIILLFGTFILPESPRWLVIKNKLSEAKYVLNKLLGNDKLVNKQLEDIKFSSSSKNSFSFFYFFHKPISTITLFCILMFALQQLSGINVIMYYSPTIYQQAGFYNTKQQLLAALLNGFVFVIFTAFGAWLVDRIGRRKLLMIGLAGMFLCLLTLSLLYNKYTIFAHSDYKMFLSIISIIGHITFFAISLGPLPYLIMSELFPLKMREYGMAIASCSNWGFNVIVSSTFLSLVNLFNMSYTFLFYSFFVFIGLIFCFFFMPETKGISLEKIERNIFSNIKIRFIGNL
jgi:SP family galactose:H+ symporter-like MFS transporter